MGKFSMAAVGLALAIVLSKPVSLAVEKLKEDDRMENEGIAKLATLFKKTKSVCIGRFLIDVPMESTVIYGPARVPYMIERLPGKGGVFDSVLRDRLSEINSTERGNAYGPTIAEGSMLGRAIEGVMPNQKIVFGVGRATAAFYHIESYQRVGEDVYVQWLSTPVDKYQSAVAKLNNIAPLIKSRMKDVIPDEAGICIDGALVMAPPLPIHEYVTLGVRLDPLPGVLLSLELANKNSIVEDALEFRVKKAERHARAAGLGSWYERITVLRRGERSIGNWRGFEILARKPPVGDLKESHEFLFESHGKAGDPYLPVIDIELNTGVEGGRANVTKTNLTDREAAWLWDRLTASIRVRPIAPTE